MNNLALYRDIILSPLFADGPIVVFIWKNLAGWPVEEVSINVERLYGYNPAEYTTAKLAFSDQVHPSDISRVFDEVAAASNGSENSFTHKPYRYRAADGSYYWVSDSTTIIRDEAGSITHYVGYLSNINEHITTRESLTEKEAWFKNLFELAPVGISLNKMSGEFIDFNSALHKICGYTKEEFLKLSYWDITPLSYEKEEQKQLQELCTKGRYGPYLKEYIHKDGHRINVLLNGTLTIDNNGDDYIWSIVQDVSELTQAKEKAEFASHSKSRFLANMSHEIRTPMNVILGFVDILCQTEQDENRRQQFEYVNQSAKSLLTVINDILDISKIENGEMSIEESPFETKTLLEDITNIYQSVAQNSGVVFKCHIDAELPKVLVSDIVRIRQILINLLGNAIKFTPENETVTLDMGYDKKSGIFTCSVSDTGVGIAQQNLAKIFNIFEQEDSSTTRQFTGAGAGLGLAISSNIVHMMNGHIDVESKINEGSRFSFSIKMGYQDELIPEMSKYTSLDVDALEIDGKALIVEDNKSNQILLGLYLDMINLEYDMASNGTEAVELCKNYDYKVIFMDENMPKMNGIEATRIIRFQESQLHKEPTKIIAVTANSLSGDREKFLAAGMDDYISKPYKAEDIKRVIDRYLLQENASLGNFF